MELLSMAVAAGIASFALNKHQIHCPSTQIRRSCVAIIRHVCVLAAGVGLPKEIVTDENTFISLLVSCDTFFSLISTGGSLLEGAKRHHSALSQMFTDENKKKLVLYKLKKRKYLTLIQKSNARKLVRNIEKRFEE